MKYAVAYSASDSQNIRPGVLLNINPKSAHAAKLSIQDGKRVKKEIKNFLVLDVIGLQGFLKNVKILVGQPSHKK